MPVLDQIGALLIDAICGVLMYAVVLRFVMQMRHASFYNPLGHFVLTLTEWAVRPLRRVIPVTRGVDWATLLLGFLIELVIVLARSYLLAPAGALRLSPALWCCLALTELVRTAGGLLIFLAIADFLVSWVNPNAPLANVIARLIRPIYLPLRRYLPAPGGIDLAPWALVLLINVGFILLNAIERVLRSTL